MASLLYLDGSVSIPALGFPVELRPQTGASYAGLEVHVDVGSQVSFSSPAMAAGATLHAPAGAHVAFSVTTGVFQVVGPNGAVLASLPTLAGNRSPAISIDGGEPAQVRVNAAGQLDPATLPENDAGGGAVSPSTDIVVQDLATYDVSAGAFTLLLDFSAGSSQAAVIRGFGADDTLVLDSPPPGWSAQLLAGDTPRELGVVVGDLDTFAATWALTLDALPPSLVATVVAAGSDADTGFAARDAVLEAAWGDWLV